MTVPSGGGVLPVDKPVGPTSHDVVGVARRALGTRAVGHTGTLDPFASGLLLLVVGDATRLSPYLTGLDKSYEADVLLGVETDTLDIEGTPVPAGDGAALEPARVERAIGALAGPSLQEPPAFSAKKVGGEAAHRRARRGESVVLEPVPVTVYEIEATRAAPPRASFRVRCSSGTYVRALARDLGRSLGVGAHLTALRRTGVGGFRVDEAITMEQLAAGQVADAWITPCEALERAGLPSLELDDGEVGAITHGRPIPAKGGVPGERSPVALVDRSGLVAIAEVADELVRPRRVFRTPTRPPPVEERGGER